MKKISRSVRGLCICVVIYLIAGLGLFAFCEHAGFEYVFDAEINAFQENTAVSAESFSDAVTDNLNAMSDVADSLAVFESLQNSEALNTLYISEMNNAYYALNILYSDGRMVNSHGEISWADGTMATEVFGNRYGVSMISELQGNNQNNLLVYVPIVDGKTELVGNIDLLSTARFISSTNTDIVRIVLFESGTGRVILDADKRVVNSNYLPFNLYNYLDNLELTEEYSIDNMMKDISRGYSGYIGVKSAADQLDFMSYAPIGYNDWYLLQVMPGEIISNEAVRVGEKITIMTAVMLTVFFALLLFMFYIIRRNSKKEEDERISLLAVNVKNDIRSRFFAEISNELKAPINAMYEMMDLCEFNADNPDRVVRCITGQRKAGNRLITIIDDMIDAAAYDEDDPRNNNRKEFSLAKQLHGLITFGSKKIREKNINLKISLCNLEHEMVIGNERRFNRVLLNVLNDLGDKVRENSNIYICLSESKTDEYDVSEYIYTITTAGPEGMGFGMEIAQEMVERMGGSFACESDAESGSRIVIKFVLRTVDVLDVGLYAEDTIIIVDDDPALIRWMEYLSGTFGLKAVCYNDAYSALSGIEKLYSEKRDVRLMIFGWKMPGMSGTQLASEVRKYAGKDVPIIIQTSLEHEELALDTHFAAVNKVMMEPIFRSEFMSLIQNVDTAVEHGKTAFPDFSDKRVLIVDDNRDNIRTMKEYLMYTGVQIDSLYDGSDAVKIFSEKKEGYYDIILMDVRMPVMDGYEATRIIRGMKGQYAKNIPIIALSANAFYEDIKKSKEAGMNSHLAKPVKYYEVYDELDRWIRH